MKYKIVCGECNMDKVYPGPSLSEAQHRAHKDGWRVGITEDGTQITLCPFCSQEAIDEGATLVNKMPPKAPPQAPEKPPSGSLLN